MDDFNKKRIKVCGVFMLYVIIPSLYPLTWWQIIMLGIMITLIIKDDLNEVLGQAAMNIGAWRNKKRDGEKKEGEEKHGEPPMETNPHS